MQMPRAGYSEGNIRVAVAGGGPGVAPDEDIAPVKERQPQAEGLRIARGAADCVERPTRITVNNGILGIRDGEFQRGTRVVLAQDDHGQAEGRRGAVETIPCRALGDGRIVKAVDLRFAVNDRVGVRLASVQRDDIPL